MRAVGLAGGLAVVTASLAAAQQPGAPLPAQASGGQSAGRPCKLQVDSIPRYVQQGTTYYGGGGVAMHCQEQPTTMTADSLAWYATISELHLFGNVHFRDSLSTLDADGATYWVKDEHLYATGHVFTRNLRTGSSLSGPNLDYYRAAQNIRDTLELRATGRPVIHFYSTHDSVPSDTAKPFVVVADRVHMRGNDRMWGGGRVTIDREALDARADSASLDLGVKHGILIGHPSVADTGQGAYRLVGRRIDFDLTDANDLRRVLSQDSADAFGPDWHLSGDTLDLAIDSGKVQRAQVWGRTRRATAVSARSTITADSLDISMPHQLVKVVWGYGRARAVSRPDSTAPDSEPDWMVGDTLRANFAQRPAVPDTGAAADTGAADTAVAAADTTHLRTEIEHVTAFSAARAYYHVDNDRERGGPRAISYARGRRIDIALRHSKVRTVNVVGQVDGIYLEPLSAAERDSARADTLRADSLRRANGQAPLLPDTLRVRPDSGTARPDTTTARPGHP